jgi:hypothetical protein
MELILIVSSTVAVYIAADDVKRGLEMREYAAEYGQICIIWKRNFNMPSVNIFVYLFNIAETGMTLIFPFSHSDQPNQCLLALL